MLELKKFFFHGIVLFGLFLASASYLYAQTTETKLALTISMHGIGKGGDNVNPLATGNMQPIHTQRTITVEVTDSANATLTKAGQMVFNATAGNFQGVVGLGTNKTGAFIIHVKLPQSLRKQYNGIVTLETGVQKTLPGISLTTGDINNDNKLSITDYNILLDCFSDLAPANNCADATKKQMSDITDDGKVNQYDYNLLLRELSVQGGDGTGTETQPTNGMPTPSGSVSIVPTMVMGGVGESMGMHLWGPGTKNVPDPIYDKCDDGTNIVAAHNAYYVIAYEGIKYPTWHPPVVVNPITGVGKCYFGHEHGTNPQKYVYWNEIVQHFGKDVNGDGKITAMVITDDGKITANDRAGIPFTIANEHMDQYYNKEGRDSIFVRHEDHVGHKIEIVNNESEMNGNSTHVMTQLTGTIGINVPYYKSGTNTYLPTGVVCSHLHKFHQGTHSGDAILNNLHEVIFHSKCTSVDVNGINAPAYYPPNTVILTGMMTFGNPGGYVRFCFNDRTTKVCPGGTNADNSCKVTDPLISKLPDAIHSNTLGRNMVDKYCFDHFAELNPGINYFNPYELWEGDLRIQKADGDMLAEHGRQWDVLDPIRYIDPSSPTGIGYNQDRCNQNLPYSGNCVRGTQGATWNSPQAAFKDLHRTAYFGRNRVSNPGGVEIWWTDPLGGNAVATQFSSGLKQRISPVEADIQKVQSRIQQLFGANNFLNDRALQRDHNSGGGTVHAPN
jgi:hypothetical protein